MKPIAFQLNWMALGMASIFLLAFCFYYFAVIAHPELNDMRPSNVHFSLLGLATMALFSILPPLVFKQDFNRISSFFTWVIYLFIYVPVTVALSFDYRLELDGRWQYQCLFMMGMFCISMSSYIPIYRFIPSLSQRYLSINKIILVLILLAIVSLSIVHYQLGDYLRFVHPIDHFSYEHRLVSRQFLAGKPLTAHLVSALAHAVVPCLIGFAFMQKKWIYLVFAAFIACYLYLVASNKSFLFLVPLCTLVGLLCNAPMQKQLTYLIAFLSGSVIVFTLLILIFKPASPIEGSFWSLVYLFLYRNIAISSETVLPYLAFFKQYPHTLLAHVHGFDLLNTSPYPEGIGVAVGEYLGVNYNMSANFWLTDGIGGFGKLGLILISLLVGLLVYFSDVLLGNQDFQFAKVCYMGSLVYLLNSSAFTTLISGGWVIIWIIFFFIRK
jgi:hypothetical protein